MGFNLQNERIQDTYQQLVQISGSTLVDGSGSVIPAITNINSVSSSYAITASYAEYAVSASHEIVHEVSSSYAETASFANFATTAGTATSATTASYIDPTFISASAAASGFGSGGGDPFPYTGSAAISGSLIITSSTNTGVGVDVSYTAFAPLARTARITPQGFQTLNADGQARIKIGGSTDAAQISSSYFNTQTYSAGPNDYGLWSAGRDGVIIFDRYPTPRVQLGLLGDNANYPEPTVYINPKLIVDGQITASIISATTAVISGSLKTTGSLSIYNYYDDGFSGGTSSVFEVNTEGPGLGKQTAIKVSNRDSLFAYPLVDMRGSEVSVNSLSLPGNGTITFSGSANGFSMESSGENLTIRAKDVLTLQAQRTTGTIRLFGGAYPVLTGTQTSVNLGHTTEPGPTPQMTITSSGHHTFRFGASGSFTGSFIGNASGLTEVPQTSQTAFFGKTDYLFDLPGDTNADPYNLHISQSGTYFVSCSGVPAGVAGPRVNIYYWPELLEIGTTAKVKFAIAKGDTLAGVTYRTNITGSSTSEWYWNSATTSPAAESSRTITRTVAFANIGIGIGSTTMVKDGDGRVFFINSNSAIVSNNYLYTGDSLNPLI
jgi:hypothetical protein